MTLDYRNEEGYKKAEEHNVLESVKKYGLFLYKKNTFTKENAPVLAATNIVAVPNFRHCASATLDLIVLVGEMDVNGKVYREGEKAFGVSSYDLSYLQVPRNVENYIHAQAMEEVSVQELREELDKNPALKAKIQKMWRET